MGDKTSFGFLVAVFLISLSAMVGYSVGRDIARSDAVKAGVGEWVVVNEMGGTEFRWKTPVKGEK